MKSGLNIVILGLSITSSWGNGHATTYRGLVRALVERGHDVLFLERDVPWYANSRDLPDPPYGELGLYDDFPDLKARFAAEVQGADLIIVGSYVPEGVTVARWAIETARGLTAFYDIDTPVTLAKLKRKDEEYLSASLVPHFDLYLSFTGGPTLVRLEQQYGARCARALYCSVDPSLYFAQTMEPRWDLGYLGTYSIDRQPGLERLLLQPARLWSEGRFAVAGAQYPSEIDWPANVERFEHIPPAEHRVFYNAQRFTLNVTRADMIAAGWSPSVRLFEAAACAVPIISDWWDGLDSLFDLDTEILVARSLQAALQILRGMPDAERVKLGRAARDRVLSAHTALHRAIELEGYVAEALSGEQSKARPRRVAQAGR